MEERQAISFPLSYPSFLIFLFFALWMTDGVEATYNGGGNGDRRGVLAVGWIGWIL